MWAQGMSGSTIGLRLGMTRGRVLGLIHRLRKKGVRVERAPDAREKRIARNTGKPAQIYIKPSKFVQPPVPTPAQVTPQGALPLEQLTSTTCRWPYGDVREPHGVLYCGVQCSPEATYCDEHHAMSRTKRMPPERVERKMSRWGNMRVMPD